MKGFASKYFGILTLNNDKCDFKVFLVFIWYFQFVQKHSCIQLKGHQCVIRHPIIPQSRPGIPFLGSCSVHNVHTDYPFSSLTRSKKGHRDLSLKYTVGLSGSNVPPAVHKEMYYEAGSEISDIPENHP